MTRFAGNFVRFIIIIGCFITQGFTQSITEQGKTNKPMVVLLHGLARSSGSMNKLQDQLEDNGFVTCNIDYPSTKHQIETLVQEHIAPVINTCIENHVTPTHFVTHSMGGILVRYLAKHKLVPNLGRVVMLSPPNKGSEVVDSLGENWFFEFVNGPAGQQLGTTNTSTPVQLGSADFEVGIITGNRSINLILSLMIEGSDDGKVSVENAKLEGMKDFLVLPATHTFIMRNKTAIRQTIHFLHHGQFEQETEQ